MNTLLVYATKHGCTETCAQLLREKLNGNVELFNLKEKKQPILANYDQIIIGGSIHMGKIQKEVSSFCTNHMAELKGKSLGLYVCGMFFERAEEELNSSFPKELLNHARAKDFLGGEFRFSQMNPLDRLIVKKVAKVDKDLSQISEEKLNRFVSLMNNCDIDCEMEGK